MWIVLHVKHDEKIFIWTPVDAIRPRIMWAGPSGDLARAPFRSAIDVGSRSSVAHALIAVASFPARW